LLVLSSNVSSHLDTLGWESELERLFGHEPLVVVCELLFVVTVPPVEGAVDAEPKGDGAENENRVLVHVLFLSLCLLY